MSRWIHVAVVIHIANMFFIPQTHQSCPALKDNMLNVHLIPHSHDDVGWIQTVDEYYFSSVQIIIDSVINALEVNPERKFIYVETAFVWLWWNARNQKERQRMIKLVNAGQLKFSGGGWVTSDEATTYYVDQIDQMTWGFRFLNDTFGPVATPTVGWQIDPFGHSKQTAYLFSQMGFDGVFMGRIDYQDKAHRIETKTMEMIWQTSSNFDSQSQLFTGILFNKYSPPNGYCFDRRCPYVDYIGDSNSFNSNVDEKVRCFIESVKEQAQSYATNNVLLTMGDDFQYEEASNNFEQMDKLIKYVNQRQANGGNVNVFYSTPSCYLSALNDANATWTVKTDDFMPYASDEHTFWTGYYTSRPTFKGFVKYTSNFLQIAKQIVSYGKVGSQNEENLNVLRRAQSVVQHHDAITGTAKQYVNDDYIRQLTSGLNSAKTAINNALARIIPKTNTLIEEQHVCHFLNVSYCEFTQGVQKFVVTVYNPLGQPVTAHVRIPVNTFNYSISGADGEAVPSQMVSVPQPVLNDPTRTPSISSQVFDLENTPALPGYELVFNAVIPPSGFTSFFVQTDGTSATQPPLAPVNTMEDVTIKNEYLLVAVDGQNGLLKSITDLVNGKTYEVTQNFYYYQGCSNAYWSESSRSSGAYIFRPMGDKHLISPTAKITTVTGPVVKEIQQIFGNYVSQVIRLYPGENKVELEWMIGPIPIDDGIGKDIVSLYSTNFTNDGIYYTDSNGREVLQRKRNYRPTWNINLKENISGNYYPINSRIYIQDLKKNSQLTVITDRSEGGGSIEDGSMEVMLHRRLLFDDGLGLGEALNEPGLDGAGLRVRGKHWLIVSSVKDAATLHRPAALQASNPPLVFIGPLATSVSDYVAQFTTNFSGLNSPLPNNVHLLTVEPWKDGTVLLRLEHFYEADDDPNGLSAPVTVNIKKLFNNFEITSIAETTLGANVWLKDNNRLNWTSISPLTSPPAQNQKIENPEENVELGNVYLQPMQIRTFVVNIK